MAMQHIEPVCKLHSDARGIVSAIIFVLRPLVHTRSSALSMRFVARRANVRCRTGIIMYVDAADGRGSDASRVLDQGKMGLGISSLQALSGALQTPMIRPYAEISAHSTIHQHVLFFDSVFKS